MEICDFIGKAVVSPESGRRFIVREITSPIIDVIDPPENEQGTCKVYRYHTINGDPFANGDLVFEDANLQAAFKSVYDSYCRTKEAYWEEYGYWMRRD